MAENVGRGHERGAAGPDRRIGRRRSLQFEIVLGGRGIDGREHGLGAIACLDQAQIVVRDDVRVGRVAAKALGDKNTSLWSMGGRYTGDVNILQSC